MSSILRTDAITTLDESFEIQVDEILDTQKSQTISGTKTFTVSPIIPDATQFDHPASKGQVDLKAPMNSPNLTGVPTAPTASAGTNTTQLATTAFVKAAVDLVPVTPDATETVKGKIEIATSAEVLAGIDTVRAVTPAGLRSGLNASGSAPIYAIRAWVNANNGGTINASGNVSTVGDGGAGIFTVNLSTAMPDVNYVPVVTCASSSWNYSGAVNISSTSSFTVYTGFEDVDSFSDIGKIFVQVTR